MTNPLHDPAFAEGCAVVFGGSGALGGASAELIAQHGSKGVIITYRSSVDKAQAVVKAIEAHGAKARAIQCDTADSVSVHNVIAEAMAEYGKIHTLVSAGGLEFGMKPLVEFTDEQFRGVIETDVFGFFNIAKAGVTAMRKTGGGSVVALVTLAIDRLLPTDGLSATPKAAVWQMVKQLAGEEGVNNIRVNAVGPGVVDGGMLTPMLEDPDVRAVVDQAMEVTPLRRKAKYEDIGHAVLYLASSRSGFVTGQHFHVDGGLSL